jgi:hypothetical protein
MKQIKVLGLIFGFVLGLMILKGNVSALTIPNIRVIPSNTPTPATIKLGKVRLLPTATPIIVKKVVDPNLIKVVTTDTPTSKLSPTPSNTEISPTEEVLSPTENPTATVTAQPAATGQSGSNMTFWFLMATIGLLAVIIVVQAWPKKNEE